MPNLEPVEERPKWESIAEFICFVIGEHATKLRDMDQSLRNIVNQYGTLLAATEQIRLQHLVIRLTMWVMALAVVSMLISVASLMVGIEIGDFISAFLDWLGSLKLGG